MTIKIRDAQISDLEQLIELQKQQAEYHIIFNKDYQSNADTIAFFVDQVKNTLQTKELRSLMKCKAIKD